MIDTPVAAASEPNAFELCFQSLLHEGRALTFPCDAAGDVDLDALSERARINYFSARATVGRDFSMPRMLRGLH